MFNLKTDFSPFSSSIGFDFLPKALFIMVLCQIQKKLYLGKLVEDVQRKLILKFLKLKKIWGKFKENLTKEYGIRLFSEAEKFINYN